MPTPDHATDEVTFITGAGSGIGRSTALTFAAEGARLVVADFPDASQEETAQLIAARRGTASGRPEEIASAVWWLSSEEKTFPVGRTLVVDDGQTVR